jgi:hypothetical protein
MVRKARNRSRVARAFSGSPLAGRRQPLTTEPLGKGLFVFRLSKAEHHESLSSRRREYVGGVADNTAAQDSCRTNTALSAMGQRGACAGLASERNEAAGQFLTALGGARLPGLPKAAGSRPRRHRSATSQRSLAPAPTASGLRWLIALMVLCCNPLAIAIDGRGCRETERGNYGMSKSKSYVRSSDGATMVEVEPHQYVNANVLQAQGRNPGGHKEDETATASRRRLTA